MNKFIFSFLSLSILFATACSKENNEKADILDRPHSNSKIELSAEGCEQTVVQNSLTALEPVIIRGQGHCWILDGYAVCKKSGSAGKSQYDTYVTTNFGWGGHHDGYYKLNDDYSADFLGTYNTTKLMIIPNCKRK